jgi:hypothetical protein
MDGEAVHFEAHSSAIAAMLRMNKLSTHVLICVTVDENKIPSLAVRRYKIHLGR